MTFHSLTSRGAIKQNKKQIKKKQKKKKKKKKKREMSVVYMCFNLLDLIYFALFLSLLFFLF